MLRFIAKILNRHGSCSSAFPRMIDGFTKWTRAWFRAPRTWRPSLPSRIVLTPQPVTLTATGAALVNQPLWDVVDISDFDVIDLNIGAFNMLDSILCQIHLQTSNQKQVDSGVSGLGQSDWLSLGGVTVRAINFLPSPMWQQLSVGSIFANGSELLRYLRWSIVFSGAGTLSFFIDGVARSRECLDQSSRPDVGKRNVPSTLPTGAGSRVYPTGRPRPAL